MQSSQAAGTQAGKCQNNRDLLRLLRKEVVLPETSSWLFRAAPYVMFSTTWVAAALVPTFATDLLFSVRDTSDETEFYTPVPEGYTTGRVKYVVVMGTVMSGLGKGIFSSSLARLLQGKGLRVAPIKLEGYLNVDSGTLNPFRHGEVFVLDDGMA